MTHPEMSPVQSSNVESIGHDPSLGELHVRFKGGGHYVYEGVGADTHQNALSAKSVGTFLSTHIKGKFKHRKLQQPASK